MLFKNLSIGKYFFYCLLIATIIKVQSQTVYSVELNTFEISKNYDTTWIDWNTIRMKQVSRNKFVITGDFSVNRNLGKEQQVSLMIFNYDAEHKKKGMLVYFLEKNVCTFLKDEYDMYTQLLEVSNLPPTDSCPFPKGEYTIENYSVNLDFLPPNTPNGHYLIEMGIKNGLRTVSRVDATVTIS